MFNTHWLPPSSHPAFVSSFLRVNSIRQLLWAWRLHTTATVCQKELLPPTESSLWSLCCCLNPPLQKLGTQTLPLSVAIFQLFPVLSFLVNVSKKHVYNLSYVCEHNLHMVVLFPVFVILVDFLLPLLNLQISPQTPSFLLLVDGPCRACSLSPFTPLFNFWS